MPDSTNTFAERAARAEAIVRPLPQSKASFDIDLKHLGGWIEKFGNDWGGFVREPDYQRGRVWTEGQQVAFVEGMLRGTVTRDLQRLQINIPHWEVDEPGGDLPRRVELIDGLQRLTAIERALAGELQLFGQPPEVFTGTRYDLRRVNTWMIKIQVHTFAWREDLLGYYLAINAGGTPHSATEIERVRGLLEAARDAADTQSPVRRGVQPGV